MLVGFLIVVTTATLVPQLGRQMFTDAYADTTTWAKTYGGFGASDGQQTADGGYIVTGRTALFAAGGSDIWVIKLDPEGNVEWEKTFGCMEKDYRASQTPQTVQQTADGGYIVLGHSEQSSTSALCADLFAIKLDAAGNVEWKKAFINANSHGANLGDIRQTADGGYIVASAMDVVTEIIEEDLWIIKLDPEGSIEWEKTYGGMEDHRGTQIPAAIRQTPEGGYIMAGSSYSFDEQGSGKFWFLKLDSDGNIEWEAGYGGEALDGPLSLEVTSDGGYIAAGVTNSFADSSSPWILKFDSDGNLEWEKLYSYSQGAIAHSIRQTLDGGYIVGGSGFLLKLDSDGNVEWNKDILGGGTSVQQTSDGGYFIVGSLIIKTDDKGNVENCTTQILEDTEIDAITTDSTIFESSAIVAESSSTVVDIDLSVEDSSLNVGIHCKPVLDTNYTLELFENQNNPSDGFVGLNKGVRAVAGTADSSVDQVNFKWMDQGGNILREVTVPISSAEDTFALDQPGEYTVQANFQSGEVTVQSLSATVSTSFFVAPESPIGAVAMVLSSVAAFGGYLYYKSRKPIGN